MQKLCSLGLFIAITLVMLSSNVSADVSKIQKITQSNGQELSLNGMGMWQRSQNDLFVAALYLPSRSKDISAINYEKIPKRVEIKISADTIHKSSFVQMWREFMSINTPKEERRGVNKDILRFLKAFKGKLVKGDYLIFDYLPNSGLYVLINGHQIAQIDNKKLIEVIINALVGQRPVTPEFKQGLLGDNSTQVSIKLTKQFLSLEPNNDRIMETKGWK